MTRFTAKYGKYIKGFLSGLDRLVLRGTIRSIAFAEGLGAYLRTRHVSLVDYEAHVQQMTELLVNNSLAEAKRDGVPIPYLDSSRVSKEDIARHIAAERRIRQGPVCVIRIVEPCWTFDMYRNRETQRRELVARPRKCLHLYHYQIHPVFGFMNARIETWFPFNVQVCVNGREWLARQMDAAGVGYQRADNCFTDVEDFGRAQELLKEQLRVNWPELLDGIARQLHPAHEQIFEGYPANYYWSVYQSEWATDIVFQDPEFMRGCYQKMVLYGITGLGSRDVMRFLGQKLTLAGEVRANFSGEVVSDMKKRQEGVRIRHSVNENSEKAYDKAYTEETAVLRVENTMNNPDDFQVYRPKEGGPEDELAWRRLRRGIADLHRRCEVSQRANERYLDALAGADDSATVGEMLAKITEHKQWKGKRVRALNPFAREDQRLLAAANNGDFTINGMRNRDLQRLMFTDEPATPEERRRRSAWVTRKIRLLRAHGILQQVSKTRRYQVTAEGRRILAAALAATATPISRLTPEALENAA